MKKAWMTAAAAAVVLAGAGWGGWTYWQGRKAAEPKAAPAPDAVELAPGALVNLQGVLRAQNVVTVAAPLDGVMEEVPVTVGEEVFESQILGRIANDFLEQNERNATLELERAQARVGALESTLLAARLEESRASADAARARSEYARAEREYQRQRILLREGATAKNTHDATQKVFESTQVESETLTALTRAIQERIQQASRDIEAARKTLAEEEEKLEQARLELAAEQVVSPVDGVVVAIRKSAGAEVKKEVDILFDIAVDLTAMEVVLEPEPPVLKRVKAGMEALVDLADLPGDGLPAAVRAVEEGKVYVEFASPTPLARPGDPAFVRLKLP
jgi:multidrug resistance efflux pump